MQPSKTLVHMAIIVIIAAVHLGKADPEKYTSCCTAVSNAEVTDPIIGFELQRPSKENKHCVLAMILTTDKHEKFCCPVRSPWVMRKYQEFMAMMRAKRTTASTLLARLTSPTPTTVFRADQSITEGSAQ